MSDLQAFDYGYQVGGTISADSSVYVERSADAELLANLEQGQFCYVFNSRQMGKSSLRARTQAKLVDRGWSCASIDLTTLVSNEINEVQLYRGLIADLTGALDLDFDRRSWLATRYDLSPVQQLGDFLSQIVLEQIKQPITIFIDEIDNLLKLKFPVDELFARIRSFYNQRSSQSSFQRLTFCLLGVATPSQLIRDPAQTPFNIGEAIELSGLELAAALKPLGNRLPGTAAEQRQTLKEILDWTGGQPFLTQRMCALVRATGEPVAALVQREMVERWQFDDPKDHFKSRRDQIMMTNPDALGRRLGCYQQVVKTGDGIKVDYSEEQMELRLAGVVKLQAGRLQVYNLIYRAVFDSVWVAERLAELRPYEKQLQAWLKSDEAQHLLRGKALQGALQFRRGKRLATEDEAFLLASTRSQARRQLLWAGTVSGIFIAVAMGAAWFGAKQIERTSAISQLEQDSRIAMNQFKTRQLEGLLEGTRALKKLKNLEGSNFRLSELATTGPVDALMSTLGQIQEKNQLQGHRGVVSTVIWSPDGKTLATGSNDGTVKLWNMASSHAIATLRGDGDPVTSMSWSPDGKTLASSSFDKIVILWNVASGQVITTLQGHSNSVSSVSWSPDGKTLATGSNDKSVKLWNVASGQSIATLQGHSAEVRSISWSPDGKTLASSSFDKTVKLWSVASGQAITTLQGHSDPVNSVSWSPDGKILATGSIDKTVKLWDVASSQAIATLQGHSNQVLSVSWSPDGKTLASGSYDQTVKLWNVASGQAISTLQDSTPVMTVSWSPDGKTLASGSEDETVKLWNVASGQAISTLQGHSNSVNTVSWSPDSKILATGSLDNTLKLWNVASGQAISTLQGHSNSVNTVSWSPDGKTLASGSDDNTVKLWNVASGQEIATLQGHSGQVRSVSWSPDGKTLATANFDETVKLWNIASGQTISTLQGHRKQVWSVSWSPDGKTLATSSEDNTVKLWNVVSGQAIATLQNYKGWALSVSWSPDGKTLATSDDNTVKLWNAASGQAIVTLQGHSNLVNSVRWSPDGKTLATGSWDNTVKLWNVASGQEIATLQGHRDKVYSVSWSPDGKTLATGSADNTVKLWPMTIDGLLDKACTYLQPYLTNPDHPERNTPKLCDYHPSP